MLTIKVDAEVEQFLRAFPRETARAVEIALDKTAFDIRGEVQDEMRRVFKNPVPYTLNSLRVTKTRNHNMQASIWFKEPDRMEEHYLVPQVLGDERKTKGFERALDEQKFIPSKGIRLNKYGNITYGNIRKILSGVKHREYVWLPDGSARKKLPPGIYERKAYRGTGLSKTEKKSLRAGGTYQRGARRGRMYSVIRGRRLKPILIHGRQHGMYRPRLDFYGIARRVFEREFHRHFDAEFQRRLK